MTFTEHLSEDAVLFNRRLTLLCAGGALALSGLLVLVAPDSDLLFAVYILLATSGSAIPAMGLRRGGSVTGPRALPRISLIIAGAIAVLLVPFFDVASARVMQFVYLTGALHPYAALMILWGLIGVIALIGAAAAVIAGIAIGRSRVVPLPWAWLGLPVLIAGIVVAAAKACITAALVMSWAGAAPEAYGLLADIQTWGAIGLGVAMIIVALTAYRRSALPAARAAVAS